MEEETLKILEKAISDVGFWRWWIVDDDKVQIEFGGVLLLNSNTLDKNSKSAIIALKFYENSFLTFYDKGEETDWHLKLHDDKIEPFTIDYDFFEFNNIENIQKIENEYPNRIIIKERNDLDGIKNILTFKAGSVAVIIGGDKFCFVDGTGQIDEKSLLERSKLWWAYWKDYWKKRGTKKAYNKDYACEVTIPIKEK